MFALEFARVKRTGPPGSVISIPPTLNALVHRRLSRVDDDVIGLLQAIAVLGPTDMESVERLLAIDDGGLRSTTAEQ
jgi:hypothetical protein